MPEQYTTSNPPHLATERRWFVTGLLYSYMGLPRSLFDFCPAPAGVDSSIVTLFLPQPVYVTHGFSIPENNWTHTVQGLSVGRAMHVLSQLDSMMFRQVQGDWRIKVKQVDVSDQLSPLRSVQLYYLLPTSLRASLEVIGVVDARAAILREHHG